MSAVPHRNACAIQMIWIRAQFFCKNELKCISQKEIAREAIGNEVFFNYWPVQLVDKFQPTHRPNTAELPVRLKFKSTELWKRIIFRGWIACGSVSKPSFKTNYLFCLRVAFVRNENLAVSTFARLHSHSLCYYHSHVSEQMYFVGAGNNSQSQNNNSPKIDWK